MNWYDLKHNQHTTFSLQSMQQGNGVLQWENAPHIQLALAAVHLPGAAEP
jgi:hypothetical protein